MTGPPPSVFGIGRGDHAWVRYAGEDERRELRAAHVTAAAARGERVVFVDAAAWAGRRGPDDVPGAPAGGGQVAVLTPGEAGFAGGRLDVRRLTAALDGQAADAARLGLRGLRVCFDMAEVMADAADDPGSTPAGGCPLAALDAPPHPQALICQGDRTRVPEDRLRAMAERHALTLEAGPSLNRHPLLCVQAVCDPAGLRLAGEIDGSNLQVLARALETAPLDGRDLRLDVRALRYADVAAVRLLARAAEAMPDGHRLVLRSPGPVIKAVLRHYPWGRRLVLEEGDWG